MRMIFPSPAFRFVAALLLAGFGQLCAQTPANHKPRVLFFSKASSWEQKIIHRGPEPLSYIETIMDQLGKEQGIEFTFSKDGTIFTPETLAKYDALFLFSSGDLTSQAHNGRGDNYPLMTLPGKVALVAAVNNGLGLVGCNTANYTFPDRLSPGEKDNAENSWRYARMIGAGYMGHNEVQPGSFSHIDRSFPGMEHLPADYRPVDQWYAFKNLMPDLHVILALHARDLRGNLYERDDYPVAWARLHGRGRVYYTTMGHTAEIWHDAVFQQMLLGGIRWAAKSVDANVAPNIATVTPHANEIPEHASHFISENPPVIDAHFPNFKVWLDITYPAHGGKRVLVYTKSAGEELPLVYRDTAWPSPLEHALLGFGDAHGIDFVFTKDGSLFTDDGLKDFDAILFLASGDPTDQPRDGLGDNYPLATESGLAAVVKAVRGGKGFLSFHSTLASRHEGSPTQALIAVIGARVTAAGAPDATRLTIADRNFPGLENVPESFGPEEDAHAESLDRNGLHVLITAPDGSPAAWTRTEAQGRVFGAVLGHSEGTWNDPAFLRLLLGAIRWTTHDDHEPTFADMAKARTPVPGAPAYGDVIVRNLHPHPAPGRAPDPYDSLSMIRQFHVTRLEWTYQLDAPFVQKLKAMGLTVGGAIEDDSGSGTRLGRVTGEDGSLVTHQWFPKDRLVGCANAPEFRAAWLAEAKRSIDAGADIMQQDDPQMALRTNPPLCHCRYCQEAFAKYREAHGAGASYEEFQKESILKFHREMHHELDAYAGRHITFSHNSTIGFSAKADWVSPAFDYANAEIEGKNTSPENFLRIVAAADGMPLVFSHRETNVQKNRRFFALTYATGAWMMLPWDVFMTGHQPRYFGAPEEYADLSGFVRANKTWLDGYEAAQCTVPRPGMHNLDTPTALAIEDGSGEVFAFARAKPGVSGAPVVVHIVDYGADPRPCQVIVRIASLGFENAEVRLREPKPYDAEEHKRTQESGDFSTLANETPVPAVVKNGWLHLPISAPHPWSILVISPRPHP